MIPSGMDDDCDKIIIVHFKLPKKFVNEMDEQAKRQLLTRSDFIRMALLEKMNRQNMVDGQHLSQ